MSQIASLPQRHAKTARSQSDAVMPELSVVIPTFKERANIAPLVERLDAALFGLAWEAIFVDDNSPDGTAEAVKAVAAEDSRVRCLRRVNRRGLAGACIEGVLSSDGGGWDTGLLARGQSVGVTFNRPGIYNVNCSPHPSMIGQIIVTGDAIASAPPVVVDRSGARGGAAQSAPAHDHQGG